METEDLHATSTNGVDLLHLDASVAVSAMWKIEPEPADSFATQHFEAAAYNGFSNLDNPFGAELNDPVSRTSAIDEHVNVNVNDQFNSFKGPAASNPIPDVATFEEHRHSKAAEMLADEHLHHDTAEKVVDEHVLHDSTITAKQHLHQVVPEKVEDLHPHHEVPQHVVDEHLSHEKVEQLHLLQDVASKLDEFNHADAEPPAASTSVEEKAKDKQTGAAKPKAASAKLSAKTPAAKTSTAKPKTVASTTKVPPARPATAKPVPAPAKKPDAPVKDDAPKRPATAGAAPKKPPVTAARKSPEVDTSAAKTSSIAVSGSAKATHARSATGTAAASAATASKITTDANKRPATAPPVRKSPPKSSDATEKLQPKAASPPNAESPSSAATSQATKTPSSKKEVRSKIGSLDHANRKPTGGNVKIFNAKVDFKNVKSRVGTFDNIKHKPGGGSVTIYDDSREMKLATEQPQSQPANDTPSDANAQLPDAAVHASAEAGAGTYRECECECECECDCEIAQARGEAKRRVGDSNLSRRTVYIESFAQLKDTQTQTQTQLFVVPCFSKRLKAAEQMDEKLGLMHALVNYRLFVAMQLDIAVFIAHSNQDADAAESDQVVEPAEPAVQRLGPYATHYSTVRRLPLNKEISQPQIGSYKMMHAARTQFHALRSQSHDEESRDGKDANLSSQREREREPDTGRYWRMHSTRTRLPLRNDQPTFGSYVQAHEAVQRFEATGLTQRTNRTFRSVSLPPIAPPAVEADAAPVSVSVSVTHAKTVQFSVTSTSPLQTSEDQPKAANNEVLSVKPPQRSNKEPATSNSNKPLKTVTAATAELEQAQKKKRELEQARERARELEKERLREREQERTRERKLKEVARERALLEAEEKREREREKARQQQEERAVKRERDLQLARERTERKKQMERERSLQLERKRELEQQRAREREAKKDQKRVNNDPIVQTNLFKSGAGAHSAVAKDDAVDNEAGPGSVSETHKTIASRRSSLPTVIDTASANQSGQDRRRDLKRHAQSTHLPRLLVPILKHSSVPVPLATGLTRASPKDQLQSDMSSFKPGKARGPPPSRNSKPTQPLAPIAESSRDKPGTSRPASQATTTGTALKPEPDATSEASKSRAGTVSESIATRDKRGAASVSLSKTAADGEAKPDNQPEQTGDDGRLSRQTVQSRTTLASQKAGSQPPVEDDIDDTDEKTQMQRERQHNMLVARLTRPQRKTDPRWNPKLAAQLDEFERRAQQERIQNVKRDYYKWRLLNMPRSRANLRPSRSVSGDTPVSVSVSSVADKDNQSLSSSRSEPQLEVDVEAAGFSIVDWDEQGDSIIMRKPRKFRLSNLPRVAAESPPRDDAAAKAISETELAHLYPAAFLERANVQFDYRNALVRASRGRRLSDTSPLPALALANQKAKQAASAQTQTPSYLMTYFANGSQPILRAQRVERITQHELAKVFH